MPASRKPATHNPHRGTGPQGAAHPGPRPAGNHKGTGDAPRPGNPWDSRLARVTAPGITGTAPAPRLQADNRPQE